MPTPWGDGGTAGESGRPLSDAERAELVRSRLRGKRSRGLEGVEDEVMSDVFDLNKARVEDRREDGVLERGTFLPNPKLSYRDKLTNAAGHEDEWKDWSDSEDGEPILLDDYVVKDVLVEPEKGPNVVFSEAEKEELWKPWRKALIIKPLHHSIGYSMLRNRVSSLWRLKGDFHLIDMGFGCFLLRLSLKADYKRVLFDGPWTVGGYCLNVRRWFPSFHPEHYQIESVVTWVRLALLPVWCYKDSALHRIGSVIGKVIKLDYSTRFVCRGRFARVCLELDITKPLLPVVYVEGVAYKLEYEGLDMICFECGRYGHRREKCPQLVPSVPVVNGGTGDLPNVVQEVPSQGVVQSGEQEVLGSVEMELPNKCNDSSSRQVRNEEDVGFGPWTLVTRKTKGKGLAAMIKGRRPSGVAPRVDLRTDVATGTQGVRSQAGQRVGVGDTPAAPSRGKSLTSSFPAGRQVHGQGGSSSLRKGEVTSILSGGSSQATAKALQQLSSLQSQFPSVRESPSKSSFTLGISSQSSVPVPSGKGGSRGRRDGKVFVKKTDVISHEVPKGGPVQGVVLSGSGCASTEFVFGARQHLKEGVGVGGSVHGEGGLLHGIVLQEDAGVHVAEQNIGAEQHVGAEQQMVDVSSVVGHDAALSIRGGNPLDIVKLIN